MSTWTVPSYGDEWTVPGYTQERELGRGALDAQGFVVTALAHVSSATFFSIRRSGMNHIAATAAYNTQATMGLKNATAIATA